MKRAVTMAMALAAVALATDPACARKQVSIGKGSVSLPKKTSPLKASGPATKGTTTKGIIMSDGRICNPRWGC